MILLDSSISTFDTFGLIASLSSIVLAIVSLTFAVIFYRWSEKSNKEITAQAQAIDSNTKKIEHLFDKLYADTFGMMKSNVEAMQQQLYGIKISSSNSDLKEPEILEECIKTIIIKSGQVTKESMCHFVQRLYPDRNYSESVIVSTIERLKNNGDIFMQRNIITPTMKSGGSNAQSKTPDK